MAEPEPLVPVKASGFQPGDVDPVNGNTFYAIPTADGGYILAS